MGKMKQGKALSRQSRVLHRETKNILCITASPSTAMIFIIARQQVLVGNWINKQSSPLVEFWSHTAGLEFGPKLQGPQKGTMNNGMCSVEGRMHQDNVCVPGVEWLVPHAKPEHYSMHQVRAMEKQKKRVVRCLFGDKELFSWNYMYFCADEWCVAFIYLH